MWKTSPARISAAFPAFALCACVSNLPEANGALPVHIISAVAVYEVKAADGPIEGFWQFGPEAPFAERRQAGTIDVVYPYERITYRYDPYGNRYLRYINGSKKAQKDIDDGQWVAPKNVVILRMYFAAIIGDRKHRLESGNVGHGEAWIATNGVTVKGTWRKASETAPTLLFGPDGEPITLTVGQTFVQVIALAYDFDIKDGAPIAAP